MLIVNLIIQPHQFIPQIYVNLLLLFQRIFDRLQRIIPSLHIMNSFLPPFQQISFTCIDLLHLQLCILEYGLRVLRFLLL